jgi:hypothetical protein
MRSIAHLLGLRFSSYSRLSAQNAKMTAAAAHSSRPRHATFVLSPLAQIAKFKNVYRYIACSNGGRLICQVLVK